MIQPYQGICLHESFWFKGNTYIYPTFYLLLPHSSMPQLTGNPQKAESWCVISVWRPVFPYWAVQYRQNRFRPPGGTFPPLETPNYLLPSSFPHKDVIVSRLTFSLSWINNWRSITQFLFTFYTFLTLSSWLSSVLTRNSLTSAGKPILMPSSAIHDSDSPLVIHPLPAPLAPLEMIWYEYSFSWSALGGGVQPPRCWTRLISMKGSWMTDLSFFFYSSTGKRP